MNWKTIKSKLQGKNRDIVRGKGISLNLKMTGFLCLMLLATMGTIASTLWVVRSQKQDGLIINLAGRQRMLTQKFTTEVLAEITSNAGSGTLSDNSKKLFDVTLHALSDGGKTYSDLEMKNEVSISRTRDKQILAKLSEVSKLWTQLCQSASSGSKANISDIQKLSVVCLKAMNQAVGMYQKNSDAKVAMLKDIQYAAGLLSILVFLTIVGYIRFKIVNPIIQASGVANAVANGDLTQSCKVSSNDEVGKLSEALNRMCSELKNLMTDIKDNAATLQDESGGLSSTAQELSSGAQQTTQQASTVAAAAEEMSVNLSNMSQSAEMMSGNVKTVAAAVEEVTASIAEVTRNAERAEQIANSASQLAEASNSKIGHLGSAADEIGKVIEVIQDIAEQTNLLALNATIEAARAGEAGKGFAVVATEVKELAKQTADATEDISNRIQAIQSSASESVQAIGEIADVIKNVNEVSQTITTAVGEQSSAAKEIAQSISEAASASEAVSANVSESAEAGKEITQNIAGVDQASKQNAKISDQTQSAAEHLANLAEKLQITTGKFTI